MTVPIPHRSPLPSPPAVRERLLHCQEQAESWAQGASPWLCPSGFPVAFLGHVPEPWGPGALSLHAQGSQLTVYVEQDNVTR